MRGPSRPLDKKSLSERDICTKFITPALRDAGWDVLSQIREEVSFTNGRIIVRGKLVSRGQGKRADYILCVKPNIPIAVIEAKDNTCTSGVFDVLDFASEDAAQDGLIRNGFQRLAEDARLQSFLRSPTPPFHQSDHLNGPIYSSGRFWRS